MCKRERSDLWRSLNKDKVAQNKKKRYWTNPEQSRELQRPLGRAYYQRTKVKRIKENLYSKVKSRSKRYDIPFNLELSDIIIPDVCPLLGIPITQGEGKHYDNSPSIDRLIPNLGYTKGNIWIISNRANRIKSDATLEELKLLVKNLEESLYEKY